MSSPLEETASQIPQSLQRNLIMHPASMRAASHLDEGYSEDTRSDAGVSDASMNFGEKDNYYDKLLDAVLSLPVDQRRDFAYAISKSMPVSHIAFNKARLDHLLYFDPVEKLPSELFLLVLADLSPRDLLNASVVSRPWRERTRDERLWRHCFANQGWMVNPEKKVSYEASVVGINGKNRAVDLERRPSRKRGRAEAFDGEPTVDSAPPPSSRPRSRAGSGEGMEGIEVTTATRSPGGTVRVESQHIPSFERDSQASDAVGQRRDSSNTDSTTEDQPSSDHLQLQPPMLYANGQNPKFSWPWLYKQRRRLEDNWAKGNYKMFSLPHPQHREEGHDECVYTIQHDGSHLVSGSRDKTIRKWDLETCRMIGQPLRGHSASVLCLQFDSRPEQDIIVSGGSDSWVIVWQFSTGKLLHKMTRAHTEPVLNLRFDDRYIVTCSKDKSIKIWNRHTIRNDDPIVPQFTLPSFNTDSDPKASNMIKQYTLLCSLTGHHAAVNAVQMQDNTIVSASGDRTIKAWDIHTGQSIKTYLGHTKGIACVQFDGRRVVSGSSDNTVRIFDADRTVEVACLEGHSNLVRTVQARFGDLDLMTDEELSEEAQRADKAVYKHMIQGGALASSSRTGGRNAGSSRPQDMMSVGARIPPGGGGSRWARIVSGSYDERVIIWSKDRDGNWRPLHSLSQNHLLQHPTRRAMARAQNLPIPANYGALNAQAPQIPQGQHLTQQGSLLLAQAHQHLTQASTLIATQQHGHNTAQPGPNQQPSPSSSASTNRNQQLHLHNNLTTNIASSSTAGNAGAGPSSSSTNTTTTANHPRANNDYASAAAALRQANNDLTAQMQYVQHAHQQQPHQTTGPQTQASGSTSSNNNNNNNTAPANASTNPHQQQQQQQPHLHTAVQQAHAQAAAQHAANQQQQQNHNAHHHNHHGPHPVPAPPRVPNPESSRVFKLQFDARRIICCSQNKVIVGWDFANGDRDLEIVGNLSSETP